MSADHLILVRHALPAVDLKVPSNEWKLDSEGLAAAERLGLLLQVDGGTKIWSSPEPKAHETALRIAKIGGRDIEIEAALTEVSRPTIGNAAAYHEAALAYLREGRMGGWEPASQSIERFSSAIATLLAEHDGETLIVVTHGLVMSLYLASIEARTMGGPVVASEFWSALEFPDAWRLDIKRSWLDRIGFTWDGLPISTETPRGAAVLVYRQAGDRIEFLLLHRSGAPEGDWAWTPPTGARFPGEDVTECARRELMEEAGLDLTLVESEFGSENWVQFLAEAPADCEIRMSEEHDAWEWVEAAEACDRCLPAIVSDPMRRALRHLQSKKGTLFRD